jgi:hypothetical protein
VGAILTAIGLTIPDLFPTKRDTSVRIQDQRSVYYVYQSADGSPLFRVVRCKGKRFYQQHLDDRDGWVRGLGDVDPVLYRLPDLLAAPNDQWILFPEGEKDSDRLASLGFVTSTSPMGASARWRDAYTEILTGRRVAILTDNDEPGLKRGETVAKTIYGHADEVKIINFPEMDPGGDVSDWLNAGNSTDELRALVEETPVWTPDTTPPLALEEPPADRAREGDVVRLFPQQTLPPALNTYYSARWSAIGPTFS